LPRNRVLSYTSKWTDGLWTNIQLIGGSTIESHWHADRIAKKSSAQLNWNASTLKIDSKFKGQGHLGYVDQLSPEEQDPANRMDGERIKPLFEAREDYAGDFKINATINTSDIGATSDRSTSGIGQVSNDKRIGTSLRTHEYGTGLYKSEESFQAEENHVIKNVQATYIPVSYSFRNGTGMSISNKWSEGTWTQIKGVSFLGEEVSSAEYLKKNATAQWPSDLKSEGNYSGRGRLKAILKGDNGQNDLVRLEEEYIGKYSSRGEVHLLDSSVDTPHIYVMNDGWLVKEVTKDIYMARYRIIIVNDGYADLGPIYITDMFPTGTQFIGSSVRPSKVGSGYANWTFVSLPIGESLTINLNLNRTNDMNELINRVSVSGGYSGRFVVAGNFSIITRNSLPNYKPKIKTLKIAKNYPADPSIIMYRIAVKNQENRNIIVRVTDFLPDGLVFLNSSIEPENLTYNLSWVIMDIAPSETKFIDLLAQASSGGQFVNRAHMDAYTIDGNGQTSEDVYVSTNLSEAIFGNYSVKYDYPSSEWGPPEWGFNYSESIFRGDITGITNICEAIGACPLGVSAEAEGFKNIYGADDSSWDIYGEENTEDIYGSDYIYGIDDIYEDDEENSSWLVRTYLGGQFLGR